MTQLQHTAWGPRNGAPSAIQALAQTSDGYLWMMCPSGLYRFDGIAFERVGLPRSPKLTSLRLYQLFAARDDSVWIGFTFGGIARLKNSHWEVYSPEDGVPPGSPTAFSQTADGTVWVASNGGFGYFDGARWSRVDPGEGLPTASERPELFVDSQGTIWVSTSTGIFTRRAGERQFRRSPYGTTTSGGFAESSTGVIWHDENTQLVPVGQNPPPATLGRGSNGGPMVDRDGAVWVEQDSLRRLAHPERAVLGVPIPSADIPDVYTSADGLTSNSVYTFLLDREGNVWVGTGLGLDRFSEPHLEAPMQSLPNRELLSKSPAIDFGIAESDEPGSLWVTNNNSSVYRYKDGRLTLFLKEKVTCILRAEDDSVWFGGPKGLWRERQAHLEFRQLPVGGLPVQALTVDKSGALWVSIVRAGIFRLKDDAWTPSGGLTTLPAGAAVTMLRDRQDRLWFSYPNGSVAVIDGDQVHMFGKAEGLQIGAVTANQPGRKDLWLGGDLGLARFDGQHFYTVPTASEIILTGITGIAESADGDLWLNGPSGIVHLDASELERNRLDPSHPVKGETLGAFEGVVGAASQIRPLPSLTQTRDGKLWFGTTGGFYALDPLHQVHNYVPAPVLIRSLTAGNRTIEPIPGLRLPVRTTAIRFDYVGLSLTAAQKVRYRYRLQGLDSDWHEITAARQALYTSLRPGPYTFRVIAANNDGVWNETGASLAFTIPPTFMQTRGFLALCLAAGALVMWVLVRWRVHQLTARMRDRFEERLAERERIARDLHDTLLQSFHGLLLQLQTAFKLLPTRPAEAKQTLGVAIDGTFEAVTEGRDAVQGLRASTLAGNDLAAAIKTLGEELRAEGIEQSSVLLRVDVAGTARTLRVLVRDEIYRIAAESLRNAFHHAGATRIEVDLYYDQQQLRLRVRDDGKGIDPQFLREEAQAGHYGIHGMRERAKLMGGSLAVWTAPESGTEVELSIPASRAYAVCPAVSRTWLVRTLLGARAPLES